MNTNNDQYVLTVANTIRDTCVKYKQSGVCMFTSLLLRDICKEYDIQVVDGYIHLNNQYIWHIWCEYDDKKIDIGTEVTIAYTPKDLIIAPTYHYTLPEGAALYNLQDKDSAEEYKIAHTTYKKYNTEGNDFETYFDEAPQVFKTIRSEVLKNVQSYRDTRKMQSNSISTVNIWSMIKTHEYDIASECATHLNMKDCTIFAPILLYTACKYEGIEIEIITNGFRVDSKQTLPHMWCEYDGQVIDVCKKIWELKKLVMDDDPDTLLIDYGNIQYTRECKPIISTEGSIRTAIVSSVDDIDKYWKTRPKHLIKIKNRIISTIKKCNNPVIQSPSHTSIRQNKIIEFKRNVCSSCSDKIANTWPVIEAIQGDIVKECITIGGISEGTAIFTSILMYSVCRSLNIDVDIVADGCTLDSMGVAMAHVWCEYYDRIIDVSKEVNEFRTDLLNMMVGAFTGWSDQKITYVHSKNNNVVPHKVINESMRQLAIREVANIDTYWMNASNIQLQIKKNIMLNKARYAKLLNDQ